MAEKGKAKDKDDENNEAQPLSPEERIAKLEKGRNINWIIMGVLLLLIVVQGVFLVIYSTQGSDPLIAENSQRVEALQQELNKLQTAYEATQTLNDNALRLEGKLERIITTIQLNNFSSLRKLMVEQEGSYQQFITALQQGMYDLSKMVKGSRTWYEVYKDDLDLVIGDSKGRAQQLSTGLVAPLKRETVSE
jgi:flagellar basal body-associated protein FliL